MGKVGGPSTIDGINAQAVAALSLFLQYIREENFSYIHLEPPGLQDFNIVFENGKTIFCEAKEWKAKFSYPDLREILENIYDDFDEERGDEVLIICKSVNQALLNNINSVRHFKYIESTFVEKKFSEKLLRILPNVKFWIINQDFRWEIIVTLLSELLGFWMPFDDLKKMADSILVNKIYLGSAKSSIYSKIEFINFLRRESENIKTNSYLYNATLKSTKEQYEALKLALKTSLDASWKIPKELSALSAQFELMHFALQELKNKKDINLKEWDVLWNINKYSYFSFGVFDIFANNLNTQENRKYVLDYYSSNIREMRSYFYLNYFEMCIERGISKILEIEENEEYLISAFNIIKSLIKSRSFPIFINSNQDEFWKNDES